MERLNPFYRILNLSGGALIGVKYDGFVAVGGFNPHLYDLEDIDFVIRLKKYGRDVRKILTVL